MKCWELCRRAGRIRRSRRRDAPEAEGRPGGIADRETCRKPDNRADACLWIDCNSVCDRSEVSLPDIRKRIPAGYSCLLLFEFLLIASFSVAKSTAALCTMRESSQVNSLMMCRKNESVAAILNSMRMVRIGRRRNTGQSWKSAKTARYRLNRNQTKGRIDYSLYQDMWVVYSHPYAVYLFP